MLFNSFNFLIFFPVVLFFYYIIPRSKRYIVLLVGSYFFYMCWNPKYILLLMTSTFSTYITARAIDSCREENKKRLSLIIGIFLNFALLGYFKYCNFFAESVMRIINHVGISVEIPPFDIVLPVGISFYVFQAVGYIIDVYRGETKAEKNILKYALFVSFFPQLVAGPIERSKNLLKQVNKVHEFDGQRAVEGILIMLWGYFIKLVIADRAAVIVNTVYGDIETYGGYI